MKLSLWPLCSLWLVILGGCTLGTRALTPAEQDVVRDMAREVSPHADEAVLREYTNSAWNHAPAWMRWFGRTLIVFATGTEYRRDNNTLRAIVFHEFGHDADAREQGIWWPFIYMADPAKWERKAWEFSDRHMEARQER